MAELSFDIRVEREGFALDLREVVPLRGITAIRGPSGAGKTTLLRVLAGLEPEVAAAISLNGERIEDRPPEARRMGVVFQDARLFPHLSVARNISYGAARRGVGQARIDEIVAALELDALMDRAPDGLSGGEARRVALGRALASDPAVLLLDEPLTGLDRSRQAEILPYIACAADKLGLPILYVSHAAREVDFLADRVLRVAGGRSLGWDEPPLALPARALGAGRFELGGAVRLLPGLTAEAGRSGELRPMGPVTLSAADPGISTAALVLAGTRRGGSVLFAGGVELAFERFAAGALLATVAEGAPVWLSAPEVGWRARGSV